MRQDLPGRPATTSAGWRMSRPPPRRQAGHPAPTCPQAHGKTILYTTHHLDEAEALCDLTDGMLDVLVRGKGANALLLPTAVLLCFALALTFAATRLFRWDNV